ncbi:hypothetical protein [Paraferrimonas sedimenticola]|uniref:Cro/C1-type HTH DNA-binding domain-containing protein n=1 Tax=Paraferrimonas sedimenticola TaxID=375674 RepID=A0AA37RST0_9GAMM|nr:hypothetical protein [Paraferrimonas sedimenticola]GLP95318.1 hypothetical protein GCM10007895_06240 [Paraferrimonas sedimenticola]
MSINQQPYQVMITALKGMHQYTGLLKNFSKKHNLPYSTLIRIAKGETKRCHFEVAKKILSALKCDNEVQLFLIDPTQPENRHG